jgi:hypothetical protein
MGIILFWRILVHPNILASTEYSLLVSVRREGGWLWSVVHG